MSATDLVLRTERLAKAAQVKPPRPVHAVNQQQLVFTPEDPGDRFELVQDAMGADLYLLSASCIMRIANLGVWIESSQEGWVHDDDNLVGGEYPEYSDFNTWLASARDLGERILRGEATLA